MGIHRFKINGLETDDLSSYIPSGGSVNAIGPEYFVDISLNDDADLEDLKALMTSLRYTFVESSPSGSPTLTDAGHGDRAGGSLHAEATTSVAGFMSAADKTKLDAL